MANEPEPHPSLSGPRGLALVAGVSILAATCTTDRPPTIVVNQRDSSGVLIVENNGSVPLDGAGWRIASAPDLTIGTADGDTTYQFFGVSGAHRTSDGRLAVVNAGSRQVRIYDAQGSFLRAFGRPGGGPEEFGVPVLGGAVDDTLVVVDQAHHRIAMVHPDAGFVRLVRVANEVGGFLNPSGTFRNGQVVFGGALDPSRTQFQQGVNRARTFYRSCNPDGSLANDFGNMLGAEFFIRTMGARGPESRPTLIPFGKVPLATAGPQRFYFGSGDRYEIEAYDPSGELVSLIRLDWDPVPVTQEDRARYIDETASRAEDENEARQLRQTLSQLPVPDVFPPYARLASDVLGYLWVEEYRRPGDETTVWTVFDPDGALVGRVTMPSDVVPLEIGADYLLGVFRDELGVEYIQLHALERPSVTEG